MTTPNNTVAGLAEKLLNVASRVESLLTAWGDSDERESRDKIAGELRALAALASPAPSAGVGVSPHVETLLAVRSVFGGIPAPCAEREALDAAIAALQHPAAPSVGGSVALHESGQMADFLNDVSASTDLTLGAARIALSEAAIRFREIAIAPETGPWIAAGDVNRLAREIDVALNGEEGAAMRPMLCDIAGQVCEEARKLGRPLLAAAPSVSPSVAGGADFLRHVASVCRGAVDLCEPKPQRTPEDDREHNGGLCLSELANIADEIERRLATAEQPERGLETPRRTAAVKAMIGLGYKWDFVLGVWMPSEQPGSAVQGESWKCEVFDRMRANAQELGFVGIADALDHIASTRATPPPAPAAEQGDASTFQGGVSAWMGECFPQGIVHDRTERGDRLLEEVLELLQSHSYDRNRVATLVDYVYGRPVGEPSQEVGGVMVTLAAYCMVAGLNMHDEGDRELARITQPEVMAKIRAKQEAKNALHFDTPLPGTAATQPEARGVEGRK